MSNSLLDDHLTNIRLPLPLRKELAMLTREAVEKSGNRDTHAALADFARRIGRRGALLARLSLDLRDAGELLTSDVLALASYNALPFNPGCQSALAAARYASGDWLGAHELYTRATESDPTSLRGFRGLEQVAEASGDTPAAEHARAQLAKVRNAAPTKRDDWATFSLHEAPRPLIRVGSKYDGGYLLSNLPGDYDLFCSGGVSDNIEFEEDFVRTFSIACHAFDPSIARMPPTSEKIKFSRKAVGFRDSESTTNFSSLIQNASHAFVKLDVEGAEYSWLAGFPDVLLPRIKQLVIEIHQPFHGLKLQLLKRLQKTHVLVHLHPNNATGLRTINDLRIPKVMECTYIRRDQFAAEPVLSASALPHPLDAPNLADRDELALDWWPFRQAQA